MSYALHWALLISLIMGVALSQHSNSEEAASQSPRQGSVLFSGDMNKKGCELLSARLVSATFDVPADALNQMKILGCRYAWHSDKETLEAGISMIRAHKSEAGATRWFATATASKSAEEMKEEMEQVSAQLDKRAELDTDVKKSTAKNLLGMVGTKAVTFEDVPGIGDEARVNDSGTVYVRVENLTFMVSAYKGAKAPPPDMQGVDIKQMAARAKENAEQWAIQTAPQRRDDGARLASAIVKEL
jgi:hypothetical protein